MAQMLAAWLGTQPVAANIFICHSVGFRVAAHLAFSQPQLAAGLVSLAGAGVPPARTFKQFLRRQTIRTLIGVARKIKPFIGEGVLNALRNRFGSRDYLAAGEAMRPTFLAAVNDNITPLCPHITQPVLLIYGDADTETPPSIAKKFSRLFPNAQLVTLPHQTHYSLIQAGRALVEKHLRPFLQALPTA